MPKKFTREFLTWPFFQSVFLLSFLNSKFLSWELSMELCCSLPETPLGWGVKQRICTWKNIFLVGLFCLLHSFSCQMLCNQSVLHLIFPLHCVSKLCLCCCPVWVWLQRCSPWERSLINGKTLHKQQREDSPSPLGLCVYPTAVSSQFVALKIFGSNIKNALFCAFCFHSLNS